MESPVLEKEREREREGGREGTTRRRRSRGCKKGPSEKMISPSRKLYHFSLYFLSFRAHPSVRPSFRFSPSLLTRSDSSSTPVLGWLPRLTLPMPRRSVVSPFARLQRRVRLRRRLFFTLSFYLRPFFSALVFFFSYPLSRHLIPARHSCPFRFTFMLSIVSFSSAFFLLYSLSLFFSPFFFASLTGCSPSARSSPNLIFSIQVCTPQRFAM